ncbi:MAG: bifunctional hydroxymethylpyrimidine kinase/phosphomethylpyrimidine kinase [Actinomycetota bacterium]|nr:bifunctional hydroxymethylpyrimidine kinase/phosphomethylpyrimidine kinase [Actinomycetota bacterium]
MSVTSSSAGRKRPVALTIAGSDSSGGAGIEADLKTFEAHGVWGTAAITAVTAQNTLGVQAVETLAPEMVRAQIASVVADLGVDAAKTGMLATAEVIESVAATVTQLGVVPLVVDPVMVASTGSRLLDPDAVQAVCDLLLPRAAVVTPNLAEAATLTGLEVVDRDGMERAVRALADMGPGAVLVKGGHLSGDTSPDCLLVPGEDPVWLDGPRLPAHGAHGSGCVLSAAICAELARGMEPADACVAAKRFVERAIAAGPLLGEGVVPVEPGWAARQHDGLP